MNWELEKARAEVAVRQARMAEVYDEAKLWQPMGQIFGCYNFHQACNELREAEERLRFLEKRELARVPANDSEREAG
jgi:hypothetical protein